MPFLYSSTTLNKVTKFDKIPSFFIDQEKLKDIEYERRHRIQRDIRFYGKVGKHLVEDIIKDEYYTFFNSIYLNEVVNIEKKEYIDNWIDFEVEDYHTFLHGTGIFSHNSPTTDPFQTLEKTYHLSEKIIRVATEFGIPVEFITKKGSNVPDAVFKLIKSHPHEHSFVQFTTMTCRNDVMRAISPTADRFGAQVKAITRAADHGIRTIVARIDPVFPLITDARADLAYIVESVKDAGATHIILSCVDIPRSMQSKFYAFAEQFTDVDAFKKLYRNDQVIAGDLNANLDYRHKLFALGKEITTQNDLTFSLCMEFEKFRSNGKWHYKGFNDQYMTSQACEGITIPLYVRKELTSTFQPFSDLSKCDGNCLASAKHGTASPCQGVCGDEMFRNARGLKLKDYRRLGKSLFPK